MVKQVDVIESSVMCFVQDVSLLGQKLEQREAIYGMVYDEMVKAILRMIHKLDLSSMKGSSSTLEVMSVI